MLLGWECDDNITATSKQPNSTQQLHKLAAQGHQQQAVLQSFASMSYTTSLVNNILSTVVQQEPLQATHALLVQQEMPSAYVCTVLEAECPSALVLGDEREDQVTVLTLSIH
jgi:hypothetical protein